MVCFNFKWKGSHLNTTASLQSSLPLLHILPLSLMSTPGRPLAEVWDHFTRSPHKKGFRAKCKYCSTELMGHTGELQRHLGLKCSVVPGPITEGAKRELEEARASLKRPQVKPEESPPGVPFTPVVRSSQGFFQVR